MKTVGINLQKHITSGLLQFNASRPSLYGLEMHLVVIYKLVKQFKPTTIILDPITNLVTVGTGSDVRAILVRLLDYLQHQQVTVLFTALTLNSYLNEQTDESISSLVDVWLMVRDIENNGVRNRDLYIMKARGMSTSNQVRNFIITGKGIKIIDVNDAPAGHEIGVARQALKLPESKKAFSKNITRYQKRAELIHKSTKRHHGK